MDRTGNYGSELSADRHVRLTAPRDAPVKTQAPKGGSPRDFRSFSPEVKSVSRKSIISTEKLQHAGTHLLYANEAYVTGPQSAAKSGRDNHLSSNLSKISEQRSVIFSQAAGKISARIPPEKNLTFLQAADSGSACSRRPRRWRRRSSSCSSVGLCSFSRR